MHRGHRPPNRRLSATGKPKRKQIMTTVNITIDQAATLIRTCGDTNTVLLRGQPGIGKSALLGMLAKEMPDYLPCYMDCSTLDLGDIAMPVVSREQMTTSYAPNARFGVYPGQTRPVLLMLDELGKSSRPVLNMLLPTILERRLGDVPLPTGSIVFATTNLDTDGVNDNIPAHAYNRMTVCVMANPTVDQWLMWAAENDIAPEVMAFAREYPQVFDCYTDMDSGDKNPYIFNPLTGNTKAFASPRSIAKSSNLIKMRAVLGAALLPALIGTVGEAAARDMEAMVMLGDSLPTHAQILAAPAKCRLPEGAGAHFLLAFMLAGRATPETLTDILTYVNRWDAFEAVVLFASQLAKTKSKVGWACMNRSYTQLAARLGVYF